jgi:hypothetical protein
VVRALNAERVRYIRSIRSSPIHPWRHTLTISKSTIPPTRSRRNSGHGSPPPLRAALPNVPHIHASYAGNPTSRSIPLLQRQHLYPLLAPNNLDTHHPGSSSHDLRSGLLNHLRSGLLNHLRSGLRNQLRSGLLNQLRSGLLNQLRSGLLNQLRSGLRYQLRSGLRY